MSGVSPAAVTYLKPGEDLLDRSEVPQTVRLAVAGQDESRRLTLAMVRLARADVSRTRDLVQRVFRMRS